MATFSDADEERCRTWELKKLRASKACLEEEQKGWEVCTNAFQPWLQEDLHGVFPGFSDRFKDFEGVAKDVFIRQVQLQKLMTEAACELQIWSLQDHRAKAADRNEEGMKVVCKWKLQAARTERRYKALRAQVDYFRKVHAYQDEAVYLKLLEGWEEIKQVLKALPGIASDVEVKAYIEADCKQSWQVAIYFKEVASEICRWVKAKILFMEALDLPCDLKGRY